MGNSPTYMYIQSGPLFTLIIIIIDFHQNIALFENFFNFKNLLETLERRKV